MLPELELAYDITENNLPKRSLIILDSIEALSEIYGISAQRIMNVLHVIWWSTPIQTSSTSSRRRTNPSWTTWATVCSSWIRMKGQCRRIRQLIDEAARREHTPLEVHVHTAGRSSQRLRPGYRMPAIHQRQAYHRIRPEPEDHIIRLLRLGQGHGRPASRRNDVNRD